MKSFLITLLLTAVASNALATTSRCNGQADPTSDIVNGSGIDPQVPSSYSSLVDGTHPYKHGPDYRVSSYQAPRFVKSEKFVEHVLGEGCMVELTFALVDYKLEQANGEVCADTFVKLYDTSTKIKSAKCAGIHTMLSPFLLFSVPINAINAVESLNNKGCATKSSCLKKEVKSLFEDHLVK